MAASKGPAVAPRALVGDRLRLLHASGLTVYAADGLTLYRSDDGGISYERCAQVDAGLREQLTAGHPLASRVTRAGLHALAEMPNGGLVAVARKRMVYAAPESARFQTTLPIERGSRPLNVAVSTSGNAYFGEYFSNRDRSSEVHVYGTTDGESWQVAWTFPAGRIRHVHGVIADPYRNGLWVLTGDRDSEAALWWTDDEFRTLTPVAQGDQRARAVQILPTRDGVIVPMDSPIERNFIHVLDARSGRLEQVAPLPGSCFTTGRARTAGGELYLVSTALEPSEVNTDPRVAFLVSSNGYDWTTVERFERDLPRVGNLCYRLGYPMLQFPSGTMAGGLVSATAQALKGAHGRVLTWSERELLAVTRDTRQRVAA